MARRYVQRADKYDHQNISSFSASEKLDGVRCMWDGGISRGLSYMEVPYCNKAKMGRFVSSPIAKGLWSRYGKPFNAPDWWLDQLPKVCIDGELWAGRGEFQFVTGVVKRIEIRDWEWERIKFKAYALPTYRYWLADGRINDSVHIDLKLKDAYKWALHKAEETGTRIIAQPQIWRNGQKILQQYENNSVYSVVEQTKLSNCISTCKRDIEPMMNRILAEGGEGLMFVDPEHYWLPEDVKYLLKWKGLQDDEGTVVGYQWGKETDKGSKLLGLMGSLIVKWQGKEFKVSGFTDEERQLSEEDYSHPGERVSEEIYSDRFPVGSVITFKYRELTKEGIPKDAGYLRKAEDF